MLLLSVIRDEGSFLRIGEELLCQHLRGLQLTLFKMYYLLIIMNSFCQMKFVITALVNYHFGDSNEHMWRMTSE